VKDVAGLVLVEYADSGLFLALELYHLVVVIHSALCQFNLGGGHMLFLLGSVNSGFRSEGIRTQKSLRRSNSMRKSRPRALLAGIFILMMPVAAFGQDQFNPEANVQNAATYFDRAVSKKRKAI
jgi:hypothetical protein